MQPVDPGTGSIRLVGAQPVQTQKPTIQHPANDRAGTVRDIVDLSSTLPRAIQTRSPATAALIAARVPEGIAFGTDPPLASPPQRAYAIHNTPQDVNAAAVGIQLGRILDLEA